MRVTAQPRPRMAEPAIDLNNFTLAPGSHTSPEKGVCLNELASLYAGESMTAYPRCVSTVMRKMGIYLNDRSSHSRRQLLKPLIPALALTGYDDLDKRRQFMALDWLVRVQAPAWLDLAGLTAEAAKLRDLRRIVDKATVEAARPIVRKANESTFSACASAAACASAVADVAAASLPWDVFDGGGKSVAGLAGAALTTTEQAAAVVSGVGLQPTVDRLRISALGLFTAMINPKRAQEWTQPQPDPRGD